MFIIHKGKSMKAFLVLFVILFTVNSFATSNPCASKARSEVAKRLGDEAEYCDIKVSKKSQSVDVISYLADISCVNEGGFYDMSDFVVFKYKKNTSGKYECKLQ